MLCKYVALIKEQGVTKKVLSIDNRKSIFKFVKQFKGGHVFGCTEKYWIQGHQRDVWMMPWYT